MNGICPTAANAKTVPITRLAGGAGGGAAAASYAKTATNPGTQTTDTSCSCENKTMDIVYMQPQTIDIGFNTLEEAQNFLNRNQNPLYNGNQQGSNPMHESQREAASGMATGRRQYQPVIADFDKSTNTYTLNDKTYSKGLSESDYAIKEQGVKTTIYNTTADTETDKPQAMVTTLNGKKVVALMPTSIDLQQIAVIEGGRISVHVVSNTAEARKGWDGTVKGNNIENNNKETGGRHTPFQNKMNEAILEIKVVQDEKGITMIQKQWVPANFTTAETNNAARKGWDGTVKGGSIQETTTNLEASSGLASGKRQHTPIAVLYDATNDVIACRWFCI